MSTTLSRISEQTLIEAITKHNPVEIHWDPQDGISPDTLCRIVSEGQEALDEYEQELVDSNFETTYQSEREIIRQLEELAEDCEFENEEANESPTDREEYLERLVQEHVVHSVNLKRLARNTGRQYFTIRCCEPITFQAFAGLRDPKGFDEILEILQISPHHYQDLVAPDSDIILPEIPEREGKNYVDIEGFRGVLRETMYGGELVFLCGMETSHVIENLDGFHTKDVEIHKGTLVMLHDYLNGAPSCDDTPLLRNLVIPTGKFSLSFDGGLRCGIQACCEMTPKPWICGFASPKSEE